MLEAILVVFIIYTCMQMPLRGKTFQQLTPKQQQLVEKNYQRYMVSGKGRQTPNMRIEEYLPILQKQAPMYLVGVVVVLIIYILFIYNVYLA